MSADLHSTAARRKLILMGAGASNLQIAGLLFRKKIPNLEITCIANEEHVLPPSALPGVLAGRYSFASACIPVQKVLERLDVLWVQDKVKAIHAQHKSLQLQEGHTMDFDWLSINATPHQHRDHIEKLVPGAIKYGFFVYPMELFAKHWHQVCCEGNTNALRITVIGGGLRGMEIALAVMLRQPQAAVTLVTQTALDPNTSDDEQTKPAKIRLLQALKDQRVTVLHDVALACNATYVKLGCGARLASNISIIAIEPRTPAWLFDNHENIFFCPVDSMEYADKICSSVSGINESKGLLTCHKLQTYFSGTSFGIAQWGRLTFQGRMVGWLKYCNDRKITQLI